MKAYQQPSQDQLQRSRDVQEDQTDSAPAISVPAAGSGTVDSKYYADLTESAGAVESTQSQTRMVEEAAEDDEASIRKKVSVQHRVSGTGLLKDAGLGAYVAYQSQKNILQVNPMQRSALITPFY